MLRKKTKKLKQELKKSTHTAIIAAFGFLIALVWRDLISEYMTTLTQISPIQGKLFSALVITIIAVLGILLTTKFLAE